MAMNGLLCFEGVSLTAWSKLPEGLKVKLPEAQSLARAALLQAYKADDEKWIPIFKQKLEVVQFPAHERAKLVAGANDIWEAWAKEQEAAGRPGQEILNFVKAEVAKYK
jgi:TRAP-type mannitol/chloroaromatic compound transport system substrate-binding protein